MFKFEPQVTAEKIAALDHAGKLPSLDGLREDDRHTVLGRLDLALLPGAIVGLTQNPAAVRLGEVHGATTAPATGVPNCVLVDAPRAGATAQLVTKGSVAVGLQGDGPIGMTVERPVGSEPGENVDGVLDPKADLVLKHRAPRRPAGRRRGPADPPGWDRAARVRVSCRRVCRRARPRSLGVAARPTGASLHHRNDGIRGS